MSARFYVLREMKEGGGQSQRGTVTETKTQTRESKAGVSGPMTLSKALFRDLVPSSVKWVTPEPTAQACGPPNGPWVGTALLYRGGQREGGVEGGQNIPCPGMDRHFPCPGNPACPA